MIGIDEAEDFLWKAEFEGWPTVFEAREDLESLPPEDRYKVLQTLSQNPYRSRDFLTALVPPLWWVTPLKWIPNLPARFGMQGVINETRQKLEGETDLWERRWLVSLMLYHLQDWQFSLQEEFVVDPSNRSFLASHTFLFGALQAFYSETCPAGKKANPLFDSDGDNVFDDEDSFPLNRFFAVDQDGDRVPDSLDVAPRDPVRWQKVPEGSRFQMSAPGFGVVLEGLYRNGTLQITVPLQFIYEEPKTRREMASIWPALRKKLEEFLSQQVPGIEVDVVNTHDAALHVVISKEFDESEYSYKWTLPTLSGDKAVPIITHEIMHHLLGYLGKEGDRYQTDFNVGGSL